jgi:hypothetical protein
VRGVPTLATPEIGKLYLDLKSELDLKVENAVRKIRSLVGGANPRPSPGPA